MQGILVKLSSKWFDNNLFNNSFNLFIGVKMAKEKIFIIDDNKMNINLLKSILTKEDYLVGATLDSTIAYKKVIEAEPDLILLDIMMPKVDGFEVCEQLKASDRTKFIPVIFLTSRNDEEGIKKAFELGAADYVTRPFNRTELLARIRTHLDLKRTHKKLLELERDSTVLAMAVTANHEINQPLTVLSGNLFLLKESLKSKNLSKKEIEYMDRMERAIAKIKFILEKFRSPNSIKIQKYIEDTKMVVFDDQV